MNTNLQSRAVASDNERRYLEYRDSRLGFLFRRCHQLASAAFTAAARRHAVTPPQFGVLACLYHYPAGLDQVSIARLIVLDKATTGIVIRSLVRRGLVSKRRGTDLRTFRAKLTARGGRAFRALDRATDDIAALFVAPLAPAERKRFLRLLAELVRVNSHGHSDKESR